MGTEKGEASCSSSSVTSQDMTMQITLDKLDGSNYPAWSQSVRMYITGRGKWSYVNGKKKVPAESDDAYALWEEENAMVQSWLLNSMTRDIRAIFLRLPTATDVWNAATQTYSIGKDVSKLYELRRQAMSTHQNGEPLSNYYGTLQMIWQEIDILRPSKMKCADDVAARETEIAEERLYDFLAGLDPKLDQVRSQVLNQTPLPTVRAAYAAVRSEELRQSAMLPSVVHESSVLITRGPWNRKKDESSFCTHCNKPRHTRENCFEIIGYPEWWKGGNKVNSSTKLLPSASACVSQLSLLPQAPNSSSMREETAPGNRGEKAHYDFSF